MNLKTVIHVLYIITLCYNVTKIYSTISRLHKLCQFFSVVAVVTKHCFAGIVCVEVFLPHYTAAPK